jgi:hypothetical protein
MDPIEQAVRRSRPGTNDPLRGRRLGSKLTTIRYLPGGRSEGAPALPRGDISFAYGMMFALRETKEFGLVMRALPPVDKARTDFIQYAKSLRLFMADAIPDD